MWSNKSKIINAIKQKGFYDNRTTAELNSAPVKPNESATNYPRNLDEPTTSRLARNENLDKKFTYLIPNDKNSQTPPRRLEC